MSGQFDGRRETHKLHPMPGSEDQLLGLTPEMKSHLGLPEECEGSNLLEATFLSDGIVISMRRELAENKQSIPVEIIRA